MNRTILIVALLAALTGGLVLDTRPAMAGFGRHGGGDGPDGGHRLERMTRVLELTAAQQEQLRALFDAGRQEAAPLRQMLEESRERLRALVEAETFDEAAVRALAASQAELRSELTVIRARTRHQVHTLLTPEQRELAAKLRPEGRGGPDGD